LIAGEWGAGAGRGASVVIGACVMGACAAAAALAETVRVVGGARIVEGLGYLVVVVAAPTLIAREAAQKDAPFALALWGTFFTLGLSIAAFAGGAMAEPIGWRSWFFASAALVVIAAMAAWASIPKDRIERVERETIWKAVSEMPKACWLLGAAFLGLTLLALSILGLRPTFLIEGQGFAPGAAGRVTGSIAIASIVGSLCYGAFANRMSEVIITASAGLVLIVGAFLAFAKAADPFQVITFAGISVLMSGILVAQTFAAVPNVATTPHLIGPTNGLVAQLGSVGALTGPPVIGALVTFAGWSVVPFVVAGFTLSFAALFAYALDSAVTPISSDS